MRPQAQKDNRIVTIAVGPSELGYSCEQSGVNIEIIDDQVVGILRQLKPPEDWRQGCDPSDGGDAW